jgi:hypothetical protein
LAAPARPIVISTAAAASVALVLTVIARIVRLLIVTIR